MVPPHVKSLHVLYDSYGPHTLYGICIIWSPHMYIWSPHALYDSYGPPYLVSNRYLMVPPYLISNRYHMVPPDVYMVSPNMWSDFMSFVTLMVPPYLIWKRYSMIPLMYICSPICTIWLLWCPPYLISNRYLMVPLTLYQTGIMLCKVVWSSQLNLMCLEAIILHMIVCTVIHNCSSSGSLFFASLRQNN